MIEIDIIRIGRVSGIRGIQVYEKGGIKTEE
jgi:hypothetical protein